MKKVYLLILVVSFIVTGNILHANDTVDEFIDKKINQGLSSLGDQISNLIPGEGDTEVTISEQDNYDIKFSLLAVRALANNPYSSLQNDHLYFTQVRISNHEPFANGDERTVLNAGLGFRTLVADYNVILGANIFHDYEFDEGHQRGSIGAELLASNFQLYVNFYERISDSINYTSGSSTLVEEVVNGYDFSAVGQLPYLPWANIIYNGYSWDSSGTDLEGNRISLEANLIRGILFEYGKNDIDNNSDDEDFYNITFKWPQSHLTPTLATHGITSYAFPVVNIKDKMLNKIRRTNNIIPQRSGGGAVVTRGS